MAHEKSVYQVWKLPAAAVIPIYKVLLGFALFKSTTRTAHVLWKNTFTSISLLRIISYVQETHYVYANSLVD